MRNGADKAKKKNDWEGGNLDFPTRSNVFPLEIGLSRKTSILAVCAPRSNANGSRPNATGP